MESPIIATFSSRVVSSASVTWKSHDLPTIVATGAPRLEDGPHVRIGLGGAAGPPGHAERGELGVLERDVLHAPEESEVLGIRARPAALDVVNAEGIQRGCSGGPCPPSRRTRPRLGYRPAGSCRKS